MIYLKNNTGFEIELPESDANGKTNFQHGETAEISYEVSEYRVKLGQERLPYNYKDIIVYNDADCNTYLSNGNLDHLGDWRTTLYIEEVK
jgi:hypothetical protein